MLTAANAVGLPVPDSPGTHRRQAKSARTSRVVNADPRRTRYLRMHARLKLRTYGEASLPRAPGRNSYALWQCACCKRPGRTVRLSLSSAPEISLGPASHGHTP